MDLIAVVNDSDEVIGQATYQQVYNQLLSCRIVHVLIFNDQEEMVLQLRSKNKFFCPGHWSTSVGGHVQPGENYEEAALREFTEELGTNTAINLLGNDIYSEEGKPKKFLAAYKTIFNGPFEINPEEVEKVEYFSLKEIQKMINEGEKFHPELLFLLQKYYQIKV